MCWDEARYGLTEWSKQTENKAERQKR